MQHCCRLRETSAASPAPRAASFIHRAHEHIQNVTNNVHFYHPSMWLWGRNVFSRVFFSVSLSVHMRDPHVTTTVWLKALSFFKQVTQAVTCPRFSREEASTTKVGVLTYYFAIFFAETAWKWNNLDSGGAHVPGTPLGSADDKNYTKKLWLLQKTKVR